MGIIGRGVKIFHLVGIVIAFSFCLWHIPLWNLSMVGVVSAVEPIKDGALTIVESPDNNQDIQDDGDGIVTEEANGDDQSTDELFEPTTDWKPVKKGQKISPGLHVRLNLQTGEREAKLMNEPKKRETNQWYAGEKMGVINTEKKRFTRDELKNALKDFKLGESDAVRSKEKDSKIKKFRSYAELKKALNEMKMSVKTEAEIVTELMSKLKEPKLNIEDMKTTLVDMEYYLHQGYHHIPAGKHVTKVCFKRLYPLTVKMIDNAMLFCDLGGMQVITRLMNNSDEDIRIKAVLTLGSAVQSNAKVQIDAIENGAQQQLLRMISVDVSEPVKKKCLFALSALLRQFPYAQKKFLELGGLSAVSDLFSKSQDELMKIKIITLLTDLVQEHDLNSAHLNGGDETQAQKARQYSEVKMRDALQRSGWCTHLSSLLHQGSGHDNVEKILNAMTVFKGTCQDQFSSLRQTLKSLSSQYSDLAKIDKEQGETDDFFYNIHSNIEKLLQDISFRREDL